MEVAASLNDQSEVTCKLQEAAHLLPNTGHGKGLSPPRQRLAFPARIVRGVDVFDLERALGINLNNHLTAARKGVIIHIWRQVHKTTRTKLFGL